MSQAGAPKTSVNQPYSSRQSVLKQLWGTEGPRDVWRILEQEAAARADGVAAELRSEAAAVELVSYDLFRRLSQIADEVSRIRDSVEQFAELQSPADLIVLYRKHPFCQSASFHRILGAFWLDALQSGNLPRIESLRRSMKLVSEIQVAVFTLRDLHRPDKDSWSQSLEENQLLCNPAFHDFLAVRARFAAENKQPEAAEGYAQMEVAIRTLCKYFLPRVQEDQEDNDEAHPGFIKVHLPLSPERAETWFILGEEFGQLAFRLSKEVNAGVRSVEEAAAEASRFKDAVSADPEVISSDDPPTEKTFLESAFLEHLLRLSTPEVIRQAIAHYCKLLVTGDWNRQDKHATFVMRCAKAVLEYWRYLEGPQLVLTEMADLIGDELPFIDESVSPRLTRDLWFTRARLLENVGNWLPEAYQTAAESYERGLAVVKVRHEYEARGRALTDYANTLKRMNVRDDEGLDAKIIGLYEEALTIFRLEKSIGGRTLALNSYAIYLNERLRGEHRDNQEKALSMIQDAIDLMEEAAQDKLDDASDFVRRTLASAYLAKSNIIRKREVGDTYESLLSALDSLHTALDRLRVGQDDQLRGIIQFDLGHLNIELYAMTGEASRAQNAMYAYREAEALLGAFPHEYSQALLGSAMLVSEVPECRTPDAIAESITRAQKALELLTDRTDLEAIARAMICLGELRSLRGEAGDFESACEFFRLAQDRFLEAGNDGNAIAVARRLASLVIEQYERDHAIERVTEAKKYLVAATEWVEQLWNQVDSVEWRYMISDQFSNIYAEIAWCQALLSEPPEEIAPSVARAKGREFVTHTRELERNSRVSEHLGEYLDQLRVDSRLAESARWRAAAKARPDASLNEDMRQAQRRLQDIDLKRRILVPPSSRDEATVPLDTVRAFLDHHPAALIWDITVSRWGTVVLLMGGRDAGHFAGIEVRVLPLKGATVLEWVREWSQAYTSFRRLKGPQREEARIQWAASTDKLLAEVAQSVMKPCIDGLKEQTLELIIAAGRLAGLPLHAAMVEEGRSLVESVDSVAYVPNIAALSVEQDLWAPPASALCVVSDIAKDLPSAARETEEVARRLQRMGADVSVLAQVGKEVGLEALKQSAPNGIEGVTVLADAPTVERVASLLPESDHFFYSGHGVGRFGDSGLVLAGADGSESRLAEHDVLSMRALSRRPLVVLSACETAMGGHGASELLDVASSFLRIGARFVVGSLWTVGDADAAKFTDELYQALSKGNSPSRAFGVAVRALKQHQSSTASRRTVKADHPINWAPFMALRGQ